MATGTGLDELREAAKYARADRGNEKAGREIPPPARYRAARSPIGLMDQTFGGS
jgi:hypothetical protein